MRKRGALDVHSAPARESGAHLRHLRVADAYDLWGRPGAKEWRLMKAMGRLQRRTVDHRIAGLGLFERSWY